MVIVTGLNRKLPPRYVAEPQVHLGSSIEIDVAAYEEEDAAFLAVGGSDNGGGVATAVWAPPMPTLTIASDLLELDEYEVRIYDEEAGRQLVAAIEIVSLANKDRPGHRRAFVAKCAALLQQQVCVAIVDLVTNRTANLYSELLEFLGHSVAASADQSPAIYAASCRLVRKAYKGQLESWMHPLAIGQPLPTLPLWLAEDLAVPLELEPTYEETCRSLRIP